ncbi:MAG: helix-turn-helix domain-containing protein [Desulfoferrobacter sp.]
MKKSDSLPNVIKPNFLSQEKETSVELNDRQLAAIPLILAGKSDQGVADELGVARETIWRWRNTDFEFKAKLNEERVRLLDSACDRLIGLVGKAVSCVEKALDEGDSKVALALLKMVNFAEDIQDPQLYETDPEELQFQHTWEEEKRNALKNKRETYATTDLGFAGMLLDRDDHTYLSACKRFLEFTKGDDSTKGSKK